MSNITMFEIKKLHGYLNFKFDFKDSTLILVGENGTGKTTVLRLLYYFLSGQWRSLAKYKFEELSVVINDVKVTLPYSLLELKIKDINSKFLHRLPLSIRQRVIELIEQNEGPIIEPELEFLLEQYDIPINYFYRELNLSSDNKGSKRDRKLNTLLQNVRKSLKAQLLYLPTYRRIEQELNLIFNWIDDDEMKHRRNRRVSQNRNQAYVELIEFGMKDVERAIDGTLEQLKDFARESLNILTLGYLGDVVDQKYLKVDVKIIQKTTDETIEKVLNRIQEDILPLKSKTHLFKTIQKVKIGENLSEHAKVICHYFIKLLGFQQELQEKEMMITKFCDVCSEYMIDKAFNYDSSSFSFSIESECPDGRVRNVKLKELSSGEKQIVSLFSHLYLSGRKNYFVLIDEPELSLSVPWQRRFLTDIKNGGFCSGLVAVTHSPFIYENELKPYTHGLGEFSI